jgi:hypothetical protein
VRELPADLAFDRVWPIRVRQPGGFGGVRGGAQRMRAHVADADGLTRGSGGGHRSRSRDVARTDATGKATANLVGSIQLAPGERSGTGDERPRAVVAWGFSLEHPENPLRAVGGPRGDETTVGFAQRLRRPHHTYLSLRGTPDTIPSGKA